MRSATLRSPNAVLSRYHTTPKAVRRGRTKTVAGLPDFENLALPDCATAVYPISNPLVACVESLHALMCTPMSQVSSYRSVAVGGSKRRTSASSWSTICILHHRVPEFQVPSLRSQSSIFDVRDRDKRLARRRRRRRRHKRCFVLAYMAPHRRPHGNVDVPRSEHGDDALCERARTRGRAARRGCIVLGGAGGREGRVRAARACAMYVSMKDGIVTVESTREPGSIVSTKKGKPLRV